MADIMRVNPHHISEFPLGVSVFGSELITSGAGTPAAMAIGAPGHVGLIYIDTDAEKVYISIDVAAETDWLLITSA